MEKRLIEERIKQLKNDFKNKKVIIWGASKLGELVAGVLRNLRIDFSVIDSRLKSTESFKIIYNPEFLEGKKETHFIIVAMGQYHKDVEEQLDAYGFVNNGNYCFIGESPKVINQIADYKDSNNNIIIGRPKQINSKVIFKGRDNKIIFEEDVTLYNTTIIFQANDGYCFIGGRSKYKGQIFVGLGCSVNIGKNLTVTNNCLISTKYWSETEGLL